MLLVKGALDNTLFWVRPIVDQFENDSLIILLPGSRVLETKKE